jgi:3-carboxy-cis,cis-muconate cycloisomerase
MTFGADSGLLSPGWVGSPAATWLDDDAWVRAMVDVEVALATAQARLGVIPATALGPIRAAADNLELDLAALADGVRATGNPVVGLVAQFTERVARIDADAANYVHRGSTSQDILDTAAMVLCARTFRAVHADLGRCADALAELARQHRDTPMAARTLTQHAVPTTFGLKAAGWLSLVLDAADRVAATRRSLPVSLGGAAGTLSAYAQYAAMAGVPASTSTLATEVARELGLAVPVAPWHGVRIPIADIASAAAITTGALGKIAADVLVLTRTEIGEVAEAVAAGRGASSAMPQKRNPVFATLVATAARQVPAQALVLFASMTSEDERSAGGWHAEWQPLRECLRNTAGAAWNAAELLAGLRVFPDRMAANLRLTGGAVLSERVSAVLAPTLGKTAAKRLLTDVSNSSTPLADALAGLPLSDVDVTDLLDPARYLGLAGELVDQILARPRSAA